MKSPRSEIFHYLRVTIIVMLLAGGMNSKLLAEKIDLLIAQLNESGNSKDITKEKEAIATQIQAIGAPAIPYLLPLLSDSNQNIRALASYTLRDIEGLTEDHLDLLIASRNRGDGWIPPAIARIGTPRAIKFLVDELVRERQQHTQVTWAIEILGPKAVPDLIEVYQKSAGWDQRLEHTMFFIFRELREKAAGAITPLLEIATNRKLHIQHRIRAINAIGAIGPAAESTVSTLLQLHKASSPRLQEASLKAIQSIGSAEATPFLVQKLRNAKKPQEKQSIIHKIASLGRQGIEAGPAILDYVDSPTSDLEISATIALGSIQYTASTPKLIELLHREDDWKVVYSASESLAQIQAQDAITPLLRVSQNHWFPMVRKVAAEAIQSIRDRTPYKRNPEYKFDLSEDVSVEEANSLRLSIMAPSRKTFVLPLRQPDRTVKKEQLEGLPVGGVHLVTLDHGEWGGFLGVIDAKGSLKIILDRCFESVHLHDQSIYAVGSVNPMENEGIVYKVTRTPKGRWVAEKWRVLPGAPRFSRLLEDGSLFVSCYGGMVLISPNGEMKSLTRAEVL